MSVHRSLRSNAGIAAIALVMLAWPAFARGADDAAKKARRELRSKRFDQVRALVSGVLFSGTRLVGAGSRGRYVGGGGALELNAERFFTDRLGAGGVLAGFPPAMNADARKLAFFRGELFGLLALDAWGGALPGSAVVGLGAGGDLSRYWSSENGRFYGLAFGRLRLFTSRDTRGQITYTAIPVALATTGVKLHEHRIEAGVSWKLLQVGTRFHTTVANGGVPDRTFVQQELGIFAGLSVY